MPRTEDYEGLPIERVHLEWVAEANNPGTGGRIVGQAYLLGLHLAVHPNNSGRIIINYPGFRGEIDGYNDKHRKLAQYMQGEGLGAVVRGEGPGWPDFDGFTDDTQLKKMMEYVLDNAYAISGAQKPEVLLIGTSAGAGAAAAVAHEYEAVTRMLLMAPGANIGIKAVKEGLERFAGEVYIVIGEQDTNVGLKAGEVFHNLATHASRKELFPIPNCDHQFTGELNGRIMSQAPFYAFALGERPKFPDPEGGMILY